MAIRNSTLEMERRVQAERARRAAGELTEALRLSVVLADPAKKNHYNDLDAIHIASQDLGSAIVDKLP